MVVRPAMMVYTREHWGGDRRRSQRWRIWRDEHKVYKNLVKPDNQQKLSMFSVLLPDYTCRSEQPLAFQQVTTISITSPPSHPAGILSMKCLKTLQNHINLKVKLIFTCWLWVHDDSWVVCVLSFTPLCVCFPCTPPVLFWKSCLPHSSVLLPVFAPVSPDCWCVSPVSCMQTLPLHILVRFSCMLCCCLLCLTSLFFLSGFLPTPCQFGHLYLCVVSCMSSYLLLD